MARIIQIEVKGEAGQYEATVNRIIERHNQLNRVAIAGAQQTASAFQNVTSVLVKLPSVLGGIAGSFAGAFSVAGIIAFTRSVLDAAGQIDDLSKRTGFSRQTLSGFKSTIEENGGTLEGFATAIQRAQRSLADIEGDGKKAGQALKAMGLNVAELTKLSPEQFFQKFAEGLSKVENANSRTAIAMRVLGREGAAQIPVVLDLADKFQTLRQRGVSDAAIQQLDKFGDALTRLKNSAIGLAQEGLAALITQFDRLFRISGVEKARADAGKYREEVDRLNEALKATQGRSVGGIFGYFPDQASKDAKLLELQKLRNEALDKFIDANDKLIRIERGEQQKPPVPAPLLDLGKEKEKIKDDSEEIFNALERIRNRITQEGERSLQEYLKGANAELENQAELATTTAEAWEFYRQHLERVKQTQLDQVEIQRQLGDAQVEYLNIIGQTTAADRLKLENAIKYLEKQKEIEEAAGRDTTVIAQRLQNAKTQLDLFGEHTINIGKTITSAIGDAFEGIILGTSKLADVGKNLLTAVGRDIIQFFAESISKKLGFENLIFSNLRGFIPQAQNALMAGAGSVGQSGGILGFFQGLLGFGGSSFGFGSAPAGVQGPSMANGGFFSQLAGSNSPFSFLGQLFGGGSGSGGGGGIGGPLSAILGWGGGLLSIINGWRSGNIGQGIGSTVGGGIGAIFGPLGFGIGSLLGSLFGGLFGGTPNPTVNVRSKLEGFFYDAIQNEFKAGKVVSRGTGQDIEGAIVTQTTNQVRQMLEGWSKDWAKILNLFPEFVHDEILPTLSHTNQLLNRIFGNLKFSEGGSRTIQQEIADLEKTFGPKGFFAASRGSIGAGLSELFTQAGFGDLATLASQQFAPVDLKSKIFPPNYPGLKPTGGVKNAQEFVDAVKQFVGLTGQIGSIGRGTGGIGTFLPEAELAGVQSRIAEVLKITSGKQFIGAVADLQEELKPTLDFLQQSIQESTNLFGRGMMAALDAASESQALRAFNQNLGEGVKEVLFRGITESFIASAQFNDLLAPIQKIIRDFTQQAIESGQTPDIGAFRSAILPNIEAISSRAETLAPLVAELAKLGVDIKGMLGLFTTGRIGGGVINITINGNVNNEEDVRDLAARLEPLLLGVQSPPV